MSCNDIWRILMWEKLLEHTNQRQEKLLIKLVN